MQTKGFFYGLTHGQAGQGSKQSCSVRSTTWSRRSAPMSTGQRKLRAANWQLGLCKHSEQVGDASPQQYGSDRGSDRRNASAISCLMRCACRHRFLIEIKPAQTPDRRSPDETSPARLDMVRAVQKQRRRAELFYSVRPRSDRGLTVGLTPGAKARGSLTGNADQLRITQKLLLNQEPFVEGPILVLLLSRRPKSVPAIRHSLVLFLGQSKPASAAAWGGWAATRGPVRAHC